MTTITDTFNRADTSAGLGTTSDGTHTWTAVQGTFGVTSNVAYCVTTPSTIPNFGFQSVTVIDGGISDGTIQATIISGSNLVLRWVDVNNFIIIAGGGSIGGGIWQQVGGTATHLVTWGLQADGTIVAATLSGTSISVTGNGSALGSTTSSAGLTATKHGLMSANNGTTGDRWDNFSIATATVTPYVRPHVNVVRQAVCRASVI